jgi:transcriptional regulator with XRE-family HTH domain
MDAFFHNPAEEVRVLLGGTIRARRIRLEISQEELADRSGLHRTYVTDVERGVRNLSLESIRRLAAALETSLSSLLAEVEASTASVQNPNLGTKANAVLPIHPSTHRCANHSKE